MSLRNIVAGILLLFVLINLSEVLTVIAYKVLIILLILLSIDIVLFRIWIEKPSIIPGSISNNSRNIHTLTLANNKLNGFAIKFASITELKYQTIPSHIKKLKFLEAFWCNCTGLTELPDEIGMLLHLDTFGARGNRIPRIPGSIGYLNPLRRLTLENNRIARLPHSFALLRNLVHLNLRQNYLERVPSELFSLRRLKFCWLNDNRIEIITPTDIFETCFMRMLNVNGNPLDGIRSLFLDMNLNIFWEKDTRKLTDDDDDSTGPWDIVWTRSVGTSSLDDADSNSWEAHQSTIAETIVKTAKFLL